MTKWMVAISALIRCLGTSLAQDCDPRMSIVRTLTHGRCPAMYCLMDEQQEIVQAMARLPLFGDPRCDQTVTTITSWTRDVAPEDGWPGFISVFAMSGADYDVLVEFYSDPPIDASKFVWSFTEADFCTTIHEDGWLVASADELANDSRFVDITVIGPIACDSGQLLMIQSGYYYWRGTWRSSYGVDWTETFSGGIPKASGTYQMDCMNIVPGGPAAFDDLVESVPTAQDNVNPTVTGLTGLDTWLWYDFTSPDSHSLVTKITVSARGTTWTLDMTAWVDEIMWNIDCEADCEYHGSLIAFDSIGSGLLARPARHRGASGRRVRRRRRRRRIGRGRPSISIERRATSLRLLRCGEVSTHSPGSRITTTPVVVSTSAQPLQRL